MGLFKSFVEAMVPIEKARTIRKNWGKKHYQPGQFGIEVEYRANKMSEPEQEFDDYAAREAFHSESDSSPPDLESWLDDNEEPEKPDPTDYAFDEHDPLVNLWNLNMEKEPMNRPLPIALKKYTPTQTEQKFSNLPERAMTFLKSEIGSTIFSVHKLYEGRGYTTGFKDTWAMLSGMTALEEFLRKFEAVHNIGAGRFESQIRNQFGVTESHFTRDQVDYLRELHYSVSEALGNWSTFQIQRAKAITPEEYASKIKDIWERDMSEWEEEYQTWKTERDEIEEAESNYDEDDAFEAWLDESPAGRRRFNYTTNRDRFTSTPEYEYDGGGVQDEIDEVEEWIGDNGGVVNDWNVHEDESGVVEISSPILSTKDLGFLKTLLEFLSTKEFDSKTGLHLHIGMPPMTDSFDLLAMAATIDEGAVLAMAGRTPDSISRYTRKKDALFENLWRTLPKDGIITDQEMRMQLNRNIDRYYGVNTIQAFQKFGTVEMRYLSSQILDRHNGIEKLFGYINYFLMLPKLARGRQQIRYNVPGAGSMIFSRRPGGSVEIKRFPTSSQQPKKPTLPMSPQKVDDLRQPQPVETPDDRKFRLQKKFGKYKEPMGPPRPPQQPNPRGWDNV